MKNCVIEDSMRAQTSFNLAAIDIGSNAARILIKRVEKTTKGVRMKKLQFLRIPLRLGLDVFSEGKIGREREKMLVRTMKVFRQLIILYNVRNYLIYATSAFRDAKNGESILRDIKKKTKLDICIITGEQEAKIIHDNCNICIDGGQRGKTSGNLLYMDVGGGSTELSMVREGKISDSCSINIGTIRLLLEQVSPSQWEDLIMQVKKITLDAENIRIIGSGGNINKLIRLVNKSDKKDNELSVVSLKNLYKKMSTMTVEELIETYDLQESRADVIVHAAQVFLTVAELVGAHTITVPNVGLADGMINIMSEQIFTKNSKIADAMHNS